MLPQPAPFRDYTVTSKAGETVSQRAWCLRQCFFDTPRGAQPLFRYTSDTFSKSFCRQSSAGPSLSHIFPPSMKRVKKRLRRVGSVQKRRKKGLEGLAAGGRSPGRRRARRSGRSRPARTGARPDAPRARRGPAWEEAALRSARPVDHRVGIVFAHRHPILLEQHCFLLTPASSCLPEYRGGLWASLASVPE